MNRAIGDIKRRVCPILERYPAVQAAYLFGFLANSTAGPGSDLNLALVGSVEEFAKQKLEILADLTSDGFERIDLVSLDAADTVLRFEAVSPNCLLYARDDFDHGSYFSKTLRQVLRFRTLFAHSARGRKSETARWSNLKSFVQARAAGRVFDELKTVFAAHL